MKLSKTIHCSWLKAYFIFLSCHWNLYIQLSILFLNNIFFKKLHMHLFILHLECMYDMVHAWR